MPIPYLKSPQGWKKDGYHVYSNKKTAKRATRPDCGKKAKRGQKKFKKFAKGLVVVLIILFFLGLISFAGVVAHYSKDLPDPNKLIARSIPESTKIYDRTGEHLLYDIHGEFKRTMINLEDIPAHMINATIVAEDRNFWQHKGFSLTGIIRAVLVNVFKGNRAQGGSTITQQFIKNSVLTTEKKYSRKIKELVLSYKIEQKFSKEEILKMYFNEIPYGSTAYGIEAAAQTYLDKSTRDLTLAEAAIIAAMPQRPTYFSPYGSHRDELFGRQKYILDQMAKEGYITEDEATNAKEEKIVFKAKLENITAPHFVMYVKEMLTERYGEKMVEQGGLKIYTTLDLEKQTMAEEIVAAQAEKNLKNYNASNAALVAIDAKTGQILTMVGSKDYWDEKTDGNVNVTIRNRQPGSSFKPIVYATAFSRGYTPQTILYDVVTTFKNFPKDYTPNNYDLKERGPVTIKKALAGSLNIPAVKTLYLAGVENVLNQADKMGYSTLQDRSRFSLSLVLGGGEIKLLEHVNAFAVFAREGEYQETTPFLKVIDKDGRAIIEYKEKKKDVLDKEVARQINAILSDNEARTYAFGANNPLHLGSSRPVAAKTGTTNDYRDGWTIGYTPSLAVGAWAGNNDNSPMKRGAAGANVAGPIWHDFMEKALEGAEAENFTAPKPIEGLEKGILMGEIPEEQTVNIDRQSGLLATEFTPPDQIIEKKYKVLHSILHYIKKDDPRGPEPESPGDDPQYESWEEAIRVYAEEEGFEIEAPPEETDDIHKPEDQPEINITSPSNGLEVTENSLDITVHAFAPRGIKKISYYLDGVLLSINESGDYSSPWTLSFSEVENGFHTIAARISDDLDNSAEDTITLNFLLPQQPPNITWNSPRDNASFYSSSLPLTINGKVSRHKDVQKITLISETSGVQTTIDTFEDLGTAEISFKWGEDATTGAHQLYAQIEDLDGQTHKSRILNLEILE